MTDPVLLALIAFATSTIAAIPGIILMLRTGRKVETVEVKLDKNTEATAAVAVDVAKTDKKVAEIHTQTNGMHAELVAMTERAAGAEGQEKGRLEEKARQLGKTLAVPARSRKTITRRTDVPQTRKKS